MVKTGYDVLRSVWIILSLAALLYCQYVFDGKPTGWPILLLNWAALPFAVFKGWDTTDFDPSDRHGIVSNLSETEGQTEVRVPTLPKIRQGWGSLSGADS